MAAYERKHRQLAQRDHQVQTEAAPGESEGEPPVDASEVAALRLQLGEAQAAAAAAAEQLAAREALVRELRAEAKEAAEGMQQLQVRGWGGGGAWLSLAAAVGCGVVSFAGIQRQAAGRCGVCPLPTLPLAPLPASLQATMTDVQAKVEADQQERERAEQELAAQDQLAAEVRAC